MKDQLLTLEEAAKRTRLPVATLRWMRAQGTGPKMGKLGRRIFIRESDLEAWIGAQFGDDKATRLMVVAHVHGCKLPPDHRGQCLSDTPHQFGPDGCEYCRNEKGRPR